MAARIKMIPVKIYTSEGDSDTMNTDYQGILADKSAGLARQFNNLTVVTLASDTPAQEKTKTQAQAVAFCNDVFGLSLPANTPVRINLDSPL